MSDKDETPMTEDLADIAAAEGLHDAPPAKKKRGRPPGPNAGKARDRSAEYKARYERDKAAGKPTGPAPKAEGPKVEVEMPFTPQELRDAMNAVGAALFALPGEFMATRRPDLADVLNVKPEEAAFGGKAVNFYVMSRFPDLMDKWGPEAMLLGAVALVYGPRLIHMAKTPKQPAPEASIDGKPAPIRAVHNQT